MDTTPIPLEKHSTLPGTRGFSDDEYSQSQFGAIYIGFISAIGLLFNVLVMMVIIVLKDHKKTTNWYVLNLAIADSLFLMLLPLNLQQNMTGQWTLGKPACVAFQGGFYVNYYAGVLFLAVMSFDRYVAIAHPVSKSWRRIRSRAGSWLLAFAVWCLAIAATIPLMMNSSISEGVCDFSFEYVHPDCVAIGIHSAVRCEVFKNIGTVKIDTIPETGDNLEDIFYEAFTDGLEYMYDSDEVDSHTKIPKNYSHPAIIAARNEHLDACFSQITVDYYTWIIGNFVLSFVVPLTVMACCYGGILYRLQNPKIRTGSKSRRCGGKDGKTHKVVDKKVRITILVVSLVVTFVICWSPLQGVILSRIKGSNLSDDACHKLRNAAVLMAYSNSFLNPILYTFLGINFGKRLKAALARILGRSVARKLDWFSKGETSFAQSVTGNSSKITKLSTVGPTQYQLSTFHQKQPTENGESDNLLRVLNETGNQPTRNDTEAEKCCNDNAN